MIVLRRSEQVTGLEGHLRVRAKLSEEEEGETGEKAEKRGCEGMAEKIEESEMKVSVGPSFARLSCAVPGRRLSRPRWVPAREEDHRPPPGHPYYVVERAWVAREL